MFERRLKIFLGIILMVMSILLLRAFQLQVVMRSDWRAQAEQFGRKTVYLKTTRGRILDHNGAEIAVDQACTDACVDYRAISRNEKWIGVLAKARVIDAQPDQYKKADKKQREAMVAEESKSVNRDIDHMWQVLADVSGQQVGDIEEIAQGIALKVAMRKRTIQYNKYLEADAAHEEKEPPSWYQKWLIEGGSTGPEIDAFEESNDEEYSVHPIVRDISNDMQIRLAKEMTRCPGLVLQRGTRRVYPYRNAGCHLLGNLSPVMREELEAQALVAKSKGIDATRQYEASDLVGRGGLEALAEPMLRGSRGEALRQAGRDDVIDVPAAAGRDLKCSIDIELQAEIQQLFANMTVPSNRKDDPRGPITTPMHGAAVVIDIKTSQVRALASFPDYDVNTFARDYESLQARELGSPLLNRATQYPLVPGSTVKPIVGLGAITQKLNVPGIGVVTPETGIECTGYLVLNGHKYPSGRCWVATMYSKTPGVQVAHHTVPVAHHGRYGNPDGHLCFADALERSCNVYFETLGAALGVDGLSYWFDRVGLGRKTGLGIPEAKGLIPRQLQSARPEDAWYGAIGQGIGATPIQMANVAATIARNGVWMRPKLIENEDVVLDPDRIDPSIPDRVDLGISSEALAAVKEGMINVVNGSAATGKGARVKGLLVAGKTGSAQTSKWKEPMRNDKGKLMLDSDDNVIYYPDRLPANADRVTDTPWYRSWGEDGTQFTHGWFIGFAPANDPQVAFAVMVEWGGAGSLAAETAGKVLERCIEHGYVTMSPQ